jgi:type I restriction enzyme S subunit
MKIVSLISICKPKQWKTISTKELKENGYPVYGANGKIGYYDSYTHEFPTVLITCRGATCGTINISEPKSYVNGNAMALDNLSEEVNLFYLSHYLKFRKLNDVISGSAQPQITGQGLAKIQIPLPPLEQQKKIAAILDAADAYRQKTKALIGKYDELTQSLFLDMFGDPVKNEKGWEKVKASKYYEVRGRVGWKGYKKTDLRDEGAIVLGATHVNSSGELDLTKVVYLSNEKFEESPEIVVKLNDLIFVQRGNTIGKIGLVRNDLGKATINPVVLIFRPIGANPLFLLYLLMNKELNREFVNSNSGSAQPMITQKFMKDFLLIKVPINLQNQFAERVQAIELQKAQAQASLVKAEELFNSLLQKAFNGELV